MAQLLRFLKSIDIFGAPLEQRYHKTESKYQSVIGGCTTIVIYLLSLIYCLYIFILWARRDLSPRVSSQSFMSDFSRLDLDYDILKVSYWKYSPELIDPFEQNVLSIYMYLWDTDKNETVLLNPEAHSHNRLGSPLFIPRIYLEFSEINGQKVVTSDFYIFLAQCQQEYHVDDGIQCASQEVVDQFFAQPMNNIQIDLKFKRLDPMSLQAEIVNQTMYMQFDNYTCFTQNYYFRTNQYQVRDSLLFGLPKIYEYVDDSFNQEQTNSLQYCKLAFNKLTYAAIYVNLNNLQKLTMYQYQNLGELLANVGSIVSLLFFVKHILLRINGYFLWEQIMASLIDQFYPEFKQIQVTYDWKWKIKQVKFKDKLVDIKYFKDLKNRLCNSMETKLSLNNIIYEMSRMFFIIRQYQNKEQIQKSHSMGIKLILPEIDVTSSTDNFDLEQMVEPNDKLLTDEDCVILNIDNRDIYRSKYKQKQPLDYYDLNYIQ